MVHGRAVLDGRLLAGIVSNLPSPLPSIIGAVGSVLNGGTTATPSTPPSTRNSTPPSAPSTPLSKPPSTPSTTPTTPSTPSTPSTPTPPTTPPTTSPTTPPTTPLTTPLTTPPSTPPSTPPTTPPTTPPSPSTPPILPPSFSTSPPPALELAHSKPPPATSFTPPPSTPSSNPPQPSPVPVQSPTNPNSTPSTDSPSPGGSSLSDGGNSATPPSASSNPSFDSGSSSSDPSSPPPPGPPSSPSTQNGPTLSTNGVLFSSDNISPSITSTTVGILAPQTTNLVTSSPLPDTISTQSAVIISDLSSLSSATDSHIKNIVTGSSPSSHTISTQSDDIIPSSFTLLNNPSSTNGPNGVPKTVSSALASPHHQLSAGQIAAIIIVLLIFFITLPIVIFILRRRSQIHRADRSTRWWFATTRSSQLYGDGATEQLIPPGTHTARSSFGTSIDHSESTPSTYVLPPFPPPMAEMGRGSVSRPAFVIDLEGTSNNNLGENRHSIGSVGSDRSQYIIVPQRNSANTELTPMSVRPFSPSESFAFPKPPEPAAGSRPTSYATSVTLANLPLPPGLSSAPSSFVPLSKPNTTKSRSSTASNVDISPYLNIPVRVICRPFKPTLPDELVVNSGDEVRVLHTFDDGWGMIEKVRKDGREGEKGLIPMACLSMTGDESEDLEPRSESRGSSYEGPCAL